MLTPVWLAAVVVLGAASLLVSFYGLAKVRSVHLLMYQLRAEIRDLHSVHLTGQYRQLEALAGLYWNLRPARAIGKTRGWAASPDFLEVAVGLCLGSRQPLLVLECGSGTSTVVLARCLELNGAGHVHSLEHDPEYAERTRRELDRHGLAAWATVHDAPLIGHRVGGREHQWYSIATLPAGPFEFVVVDGPPSSTGQLSRHAVLPLLWQRLAPGFSLLLDDAARPDERAVIARWTTEYPDLTIDTLNLEKGAALVSRRSRT